ncbi:MAG: hypothetical protein KGK14_06645, partial [Bacteroidota bacterium]|nr:hypothetical protein [Bacteroidota bacterium]
NSIGSKALNLARFLQWDIKQVNNSGSNVSFVIPFYFFHNYIQTVVPKENFEKLADSNTDESTAVTICAQIREAILSGSIPSDWKLIDQVETFMNEWKSSISFKESAGRPFYADGAIFRSSTNCEDLPGFPSAGLYISEPLTDLSPKQIETAILKVWASVYLEKAYLPALHEHGFEKIGVFTRYDNDTATDKRIYLFIPNSSVQKLLLLDDVILKDVHLQKNGSNYLQAPYNMPPYERIETIVLSAFQDHPLFSLPTLNGPLKDRIYELRSYEGSNETFYRQKVKMFNQGGEIGIFKQLNFNAVFYAEVLSGCHMPDLMYMTTFNNMADRDAHWKLFGDSPAWKTLSALPEYQHTVSTANIYLLHPTDFSDF